jgi:hypothetical protein
VTRDPKFLLRRRREGDRPTPCSTLQLRQFEDGVVQHLQSVVVEPADVRVSIGLDTRQSVLVTARDVARLTGNHSSLARDEVGDGGAEGECEMRP